MTLLYLSRGDMEALKLTAADIVGCIEHLSRGRETGSVSNAPKSALKPDPDRFFMSTLAVADDPPFMAVKSLGMNATNGQRDLPSIGALITLFDGLSGHPVAVMDGDWITAQRTAGLSALAAKYMARPNSSALAFVGCGAQAQSHLELLTEMFPITEIRALGRGAANRDALCQRGRQMGLTAIAAADARDALDGADIVITSVPGSSALQPFLDTEWLQPGAFVSMVDLARSWFPDGLDRFSHIIIDDAPQEATMKTPMVKMSLVKGDLQDLVSGREPGRASDEECTAFAFRGLAIGDLALAAAAYQRAVEMDMGISLPR